MRLITAIGLTFLGTVVGIQAQQVTWPVSQGGNGRQYQAVAVPAGITWISANQAAVAVGEHLATIAAQAENAFVFNLISGSESWNSGLGPWLACFQHPGSPEPDGVCFDSTGRLLGSVSQVVRVTAH